MSRLTVGCLLCIAAAWAQGDRGQARRRAPNPCASGTDPVYGRLANATGGQQYFLHGRDVEKAGDLMAAKISHPIEVYFAYGVLQRGQPRDFALWIDSTIESASFSVVVQCKDSIVIWRPSGEVVTSGGAAGFASTETASARLLTVSRPETGAWRIRMSGSGEASVSVQAKTELHLGGFEFVRVGGRPGHEGLFRIQGQPTSPDQIARARMDGKFRSANFLFVSDVGERLHGMELRRDGDEFTGNVLLPAGPFRVMVEGYDERGLPYQRVLSRLYRLQTIEITPVTHVEELRAGTTTKMAFQIRNGGPPGTLEVMVVWVGRNFVKTAPPTRLSLAPGAAATIEAEVDIPADAVLHTEVSVTVTASRVTPPASENGIVLQYLIPGNANQTGRELLPTYSASEKNCWTF